MAPVLCWADRPYIPTPSWRTDLGQVAQHCLYPVAQQQDTAPHPLPWWGRGGVLTRTIVSSLLGQLRKKQQDMLPNTVINPQIHLRFYRA
jgi:hypothetical protein